MTKKVDWTKAPLAAVCFAHDAFRDNKCWWWDSGSWYTGGYTEHEIATAEDFEVRPDEFKSKEYYMLQARSGVLYKPDYLTQPEEGFNHPKTSIQFLDKVKATQEERAAEYEQEGGERSFAKIAGVFNTYRGKDLEPSDIALILEILKNVRFYSQDGYHRDSVIDKVSYASLWAELITEERNC